MRCPALLIAELRMPVESVGYCDGVSTSNVDGACDSQVSEERTGDNGVSRASSFSGEKWMREQKKERHSKVARIGKLAKAAENTDERELGGFQSITHSLRLTSFLYRAHGKCSYVVARNFFQLLLNCSAWPCLGPA